MYVVLYFCDQTPPSISHRPQTVAALPKVLNEIVATGASHMYKKCIFAAFLHCLRTAAVLSPRKKKISLLLYVSCM